MAWRVPVTLAVWAHPHLSLISNSVVRIDFHLSRKERHFVVVNRIEEAFISIVGT